MSHCVRILSSPIPGVYATCSASAQHFARHWHDDFGVGVIDRGAQRWRSRRGIVEAQGGAVINTIPGEVHDGIPVGARSRHWRIVSMPPALLDRVTGHEGGTMEIRSPVIEDIPLALALRHWLELFERWATGERADTDVLAFEQAMTECCAAYVARHGTRRVPTASVDVDVAVVRERLSSGAGPVPSLGDLADSVGLSRFQLLRRFRARYGVPPHAWVLNRRAEVARRLIAGGATLSGAALRAGFADQSHMTRTFRKFYGYTPGTWQRQ